jgi:hypothetical protein
VVEERHKPWDGNKDEQQGRDDPEDEPLSILGTIRNAICFRITTLVHLIKLLEGKPEEHHDERDEGRPAWLQGRKVADPRSSDAQAQ